MLRTILVLALSAIAPEALPARPAVPQEDGQVAQLLSEQLAGAEDLAVDELWGRAEDLRRRAGVPGVAELDPRLDAELREGALGPRARLLAVACRLRGREPDLPLLAEALSPVLGAPPELASAAAGLLASPAFAELERGSRLPLAGALLARAEAAGDDPDLEIELARAAFRIGGGAERRVARAMLQDALTRPEEELRARAALALADAGEPLLGAVRAELERVAALPGPQGALAASHLRHDHLERLRERKYRALQSLYDQNVLSKELETFDAVVRMVEERHPDGDRFTRAELVGLALNGMLRALDPHSSYMSAPSYRRFHEELLHGWYGGIGAFVNVDRNDGLLTISRPIYSGPAYQAGLHSDDKIVRIGDWPTLDEPVDEAVKHLKGRPGTEVTLYVWRRGMDPGLIERPTEHMAIVVERAEIAIPTVSAQMLPGRVGLVQLDDFNPLASRKLEEAIVELLDQGMRALVLDLSRNQGGLLTEARAVADLFLPRGKLVVSTEGRLGPPERLFTERPALLPADVPMAVLIDRFSASASEIVAGALQDHDRAVLVGERSYGKGSVQDLQPVEGAPEDEYLDENGNGRFDNWERIVRDHDGDGEFDFAPRVRLTIARYFLPSGRSIHRELDEDGNVVSMGGVSPDEAARQPRVDAWRVQERLRLRSEGRVQDWVDRHWVELRDRLTELAYCDYEDPDAYPDFRALFESLSTPLPDQDVCAELRLELRRRVQDERGAAFPQADFQEDVALQRAIATLLGELGERPDDHAEYASTFEEDEAGDLRDRLLAKGMETDELAAARSALEAAREGDGRVSRPVLERLLELLGTADGE